MTQNATTTIEDSSTKRSIESLDEESLDEEDLIDTSAARSSIGMLFANSVGTETIDQQDEASALPNSEGTADAPPNSEGTAEAPISPASVGTLSMQHPTGNSTTSCKFDVLYAYIGIFTTLVILPLR